VIHLVGCELLGEDRERVDERLRGIADTLTEVFEKADADGLSAAAAADAIVEQRLTGGSP